VLLLFSEAQAGLVLEHLQVVLEHLQDYSLLSQRKPDVERESAGSLIIKFFGHLNKITVTVTVTVTVNLSEIPPRIPALPRITQNLFC
jgi:hypothetical protein